MVGYKFSKEELCRARNVDLGGLLLEVDEQRFYTDSSGYVRDRNNERFKVDRVHNRYYTNTEGTYSAGNAIDYFVDIIGLGFVKAVEVLLAYEDKSIKIQRQVYCSEEKELSKEEYVRLVKTAEKKGNERLSLLLQTICGTGIRVSELQYITVEAVTRGEAIVSLKGKTRTVFIVKELRNKLLRYTTTQKIDSGMIFITSGGKPINRTNIWKDMKNLCEQANVNPNKVFPHNLRHLFARSFYGIEKDIVRLADVLGHSSVDTTRIYIITTGNEHRQRMESMRLII